MCGLERKLKTVTILYGIILQESAQEKILFGAPSAQEFRANALSLRVCPGTSSPRELLL